MPPRPSDSGFSLNEILIGVVLSGILAAFMYKVVGRITQASTKSTNETAASAQMEQVASILLREIRQIEPPATGKPIVLTASSVLYPRRDKSIEIKFDSLLRHVLRLNWTGTTTNSSILANELDRFELTYMDKKGQPLTSIPSDPIESLATSPAKDLASIQIVFSRKGETLSRIVRLRNYGDSL